MKAVKVDGRKKRNWRFKDMTGLKFGRLLVTRFDCLSNQNRAKWMCLCDCGGVVSVNGPLLRSGHTQSCGCLHRQRTGDAHRIHGMSGGRLAEYAVWSSMKQRCLNPRNKNFKHYGARGITVCQRWMNFENFISDMGFRPHRLTLERVNNDRGYEPDNCKWATYKEQSANKRKPQHI